MQKVIVVTPVYNDWESAAFVWKGLDDAFSCRNDVQVSILCVDDGSTQKFDSNLDQFRFVSLQDLRILRLRRNMGHQRAIAIGLSYIYEHLICDAVICMDADGEDRAEDAPVLLDHFNAIDGNTAVFASRRRRLESKFFQTGYALFRLAHRALLGFGVKIGNFSVLPFGHLSALVVSKDLWSHYAATVVKLRLPMKTLPVDRGLRFAGHSKMNYVSLVNHGLSAISVFGELLATRLLIGGVTGVSLIVLFCAGLICLHSKDGLPSFDWITISVIFLFQITVGALVVALAFSFGVFFRRDQLGFLPMRDSGYFVEEVLSVYERSRVRV